MAGGDDEVCGCDGDVGDGVPVHEALLIVLTTRQVLYNYRFFTQKNGQKTGEGINLLISEFFIL